MPADHANARPGASAPAPRVSVVIPNYNQTRYLPAAIRSVLGQDHPAFEVIVVDDGSTDGCIDVVRSFGPAVTYIKQENAGLAGARNTGILAAQGEFIGLLDADDAWRPEYLRALLDLFARDEGASVCYCQAQAVDEAGTPLDRWFGGPPVAPEVLRRTLLRANFLIPSTILMRRDAVIGAGLFDATLRSCEDWDLWLRMLPGHRFVGTPACLVSYRVHAASLSADPDRMRQAALAVIAKNLGPDDGERDSWSADKRRAYGGVYRYCALKGIDLRGEWAPAVEYLRRAIDVDASLADDTDLFYELVLGPDLPGGRAVDADGSFSRRVERALDLAEAVSAGCGGREDYVATALHGTGIAAYNAGHRGLARALLWQALRRRPALWRNRVVVGDLLKSILRPHGRS